MKLELEGVKELINELERVSDDVAGDLAKVIKKGGKIVRDAAKSNIESQGLVKTGALRDSMKMRITEKDRSQVEATIGPTKFYGRFHEFGTKKMKARPFLRPAFDENSDKVQEVIADELRKTIERKL